MEFDQVIRDIESYFCESRKSKIIHASVIEFDQWLRSKIKYEDYETIDIQEVRDKLHEFLEVDLYD